MLINKAVTVNGKRSLVVSKKDLNSTIITDGQTVYYSTSSQNAVVYNKDLLGNTSKVMFLNPGSFCAYSLKNKTHKLINTNEQYAEQYNQYFYLSPYQGSAGPTVLTVYDAKAQKSKIVSHQLERYEIIENLLYCVTYAKEMNYYHRPYTINLYKYNLSGENAVTLIQNLEVQEIVDITSKKVVYLDKNGIRTERYY